MLSLLLGGCTAHDVLDTGSAVPGLLFLDEQGSPDFRLASRVSDERADTVFQVPYGGFLYEFDVDDVGIAMAYTPPADEGEEGYDRSGIYRVVDGEAVHLACADEAGMWCFYPQWSMDGQGVWFVMDDQREPDSVPTLAYVDVGSGVVDLVVPWATEPAVGPQGIAWIGLDPETRARSLEMGDAQGQWQRTLVASGQVYDLGQPTFSVDGEVWFLILIEQLTRSWWPSVLGTAHAHGLHNQPGDWWSVSLDGGALTRRTFMELTHYDGALDDEGRLATATELGLAVVDGDEVAWVWIARSLRATDWAVTQGE